jgi:photosystem II 22kDa protein
MTSALAPFPTPQFELPSIEFGEISLSNLSLSISKTNELFLGRVAMIGLSASLIGEILTGAGPLGQLGYEAGSPIAPDWFVLLLLLGNLVPPLLPTTQVFVSEQELAEIERMRQEVAAELSALASASGGRRGSGSNGNGRERGEGGAGAAAAAARPGGTGGALQGEGPSGRTGGPFSLLPSISKAQALTIGKGCQLFFSLSLLGEMISGYGPLNNLGFEVGVHIHDENALVVAAVVALLYAAASEGTGRFVEGSDEEEGAKEVEGAGTQPRT